MKRETFFVVVLIAICASLFPWPALAQQNQTEATPKVPPVSGGARIVFLNRDDTDIIAPSIKPLPAALFLSNWTNIPVCTALKPQTETSITISPTDPLNLVGVWIDWQRSTEVQLIMNAGYGYTENGGLNWQTGLIIAPYDKQFDPSIAADKNGNFYYCFDAQNSGDWYDQPGGIFVAKSNAASKGATWGTPVAVVEHTTYPSPHFEDKPYIAVDATNSAYAGNIYVAWTRFSTAQSLDTTRILFTKSINGGASFSQSFIELEKAIRYEDEVPGPGDVIIGAMPAIGANGEVYVTWLKYDAKDMDNPDKNFIRFKKSTNGGTSFGILNSVAGIKAVRYIKGLLPAPSFPSMAVDRNNGYIYIVWSAKSNSGDLDIYLSKSTNGGSTWSASPIRVNQDPFGNSKDQFLPWIAVDPTGRIGIIYYDQRNYSSSDPWVDLYLAESLNYGTSFSEYQINDAAINVEDYWFPPNKFIGDYLGVASDVGYVYPLWTDTHNGSEDIYTARVNRPPTSNDQLATAYNNGRRIIRTNDGTLHLVYQTNSEIYYAKSTDSGTSWSAYQRLSTGNGNHKYPSITGTSTKQFVVWQRYTGYSGGQHKYDTYCAKNTGSGWTTTTISNLSNLGFSTQTDPLPVVTYKTRSGGYRLLVCVKTSSAIKFVTSDNDGTTWSTASNLPSTSSSHQNPSLSMGPNTPASTVYASYDDGSNVYYNTYVSAWGTAVNISSGIGTTNNRYPSVEVDGNGGKNFAWQGYSTPLEMTVIVHRRNSESFQIFANGGDGGNRPSITGLTSNKRAIVCTSDNFTDIFKLYYNGSSWSHTLVANNGQHPNLSAGTTTAKYVWNSGTAAPYEIKISSESLSKSSLENWAYHRAAVLQDTANVSLLWIELGEITLASSQQEFTIAQTSIRNQDLNLQATELFHYLDSEPFVIPADSSRLIWYQQLYGQGFSRLAATPSSDVTVAIQLIDAATESALATLHQTVLVSSSDSSRSKGLLSHNVSAYKGQQVKFRVAVAGLATKMAGIVPGVTEIHFLNPTGFGKPHPKENDEPSAAKPEAFMLSQNFPNPFNATTEIRYQLPEAVQVRLVIYTVLGQEVRTLVDREESAGLHTIRWDGKDAQAQELVSGIYIYQIEAGTFIAGKKLVLIR